MSALGHVWTAPWQELSDAAEALVGCGHVCGLFVAVKPLAIGRGRRELGSKSKIRKLELLLALLM